MKRITLEITWNYFSQLLETGGKQQKNLQAARPGQRTIPVASHKTDDRSHRPAIYASLKASQLSLSWEQLNQDQLASLSANPTLEFQRRAD